MTCALRNRDGLKWGPTIAFTESDVILSDVDIKTWISSSRLKVVPYDEDMLSGATLSLRPGKVVKRLKETTSPFSPTSEDGHYTKEQTKTKFTVHPHERILCSTLEKVVMPQDLVGVIELRSYYSRQGIFIPPTKIDPGFTGNLTILIVGSSFPVNIYLSEPLLHVVFSKLLSPSQIVYDSRYTRIFGEEPITPVIKLGEEEVHWCDLEGQLSKQRLIGHDKDSGKFIYECMNDKSTNEFAADELF